MNDLQKQLLEMFTFLHDYCETNNITYYAIGGTFLGAVRHGGFIPWDDDIDICMPRPDYERFIELSKDLNGDYIVETPRSSKQDFLYTNTKLYSKKTTAIERTGFSCKRGIFIDIFPLDGIGNTLEECKNNYLPIYRKHMLLATKTCKIRKDRGLLKNCAIALSSLVPNSIFNAKRMILDLDRMISRIPYNDSKYVGILLTVRGDKAITAKHFYEKRRLYTFEHTHIYGVEDYDGYLTCYFGNWRELPPENKRTSGHEFDLLDLYKSFSC